MWPECITVHVPTCASTETGVSASSTPRGGRRWVRCMAACRICPVPEELCSWQSRLRLTLFNSLCIVASLGCTGAHGITVRLFFSVGHECRLVAIDSTDWDISGSPEFEIHMMKKYYILKYSHYMPWERQRKQSMNTHWLSI